MVSLRSFRLASLSGHVLQFEANKPRPVPQDAVREAMTAGCVPVDKADAPVYDDSNAPKFDFESDVRKSLIYLAIDAVAADNRTSDFDAAGMPKQRVVMDRVGFEVQGAEIVEVFRERSAALSEGRDFVLHESAPNLIRVVQATTVGELKELAKEFERDPTELTGKSLRDAKRILVSAFAGSITV